MTPPGEVPVTTLRRGTRPLLVSLPHVGQRLHAQVAPRLVERALAVEDTDWFLDAVYAFAADLGASLLVPAYSRYVIDLNRPPENTPMYPGANNTELVPTRFFTGEPLYRPGQAPDEADIAWRRETFWRPYHDTLAGELARLRAEHGHAILWDGHSIRSQLPWLFEGTLPDLNLGTAAGASCAPSLRAALGATVAAQSRFSHVLDGRFKGGHITRHYGRPIERIHAVQLEMCWSTYMAEEPPFTLDAARITQLEPVLRALLQTCIDWSPER